MRCTWAFSARPYPQTACFTVAGAYSTQGTSAIAQATSAAPRACPTESAIRASAPTYDSSIATASGSCRAMSSATSSWIRLSRAAAASRGEVSHQPYSTALRRPPSPVATMPKPHAAVPGSMPRTFTDRG